MVERLAKKSWSFREITHDDLRGEEETARWWLNAIADELEQRDTPLPLVRRTWVIHYLRGQAKAGTP